MYIYSVISCGGAEKDISRPDYEPVMNILIMFIIYSSLSLLPTSENDLGGIC